MSTFGETVEGYTINVLNEREIRASAGLLFLFMFIAIVTVMFTRDFTMLKYMVTIFMVEMAIRVFINPKYAPFLIIGRFMVRKQTPLYVGAPQKKFAWIIGLVLSASMFVLLSIMNTYSPIVGVICIVCLFFLFFEVAFNICIGCKLYGLFYKEKAQYCPGEICELKDRQEIQRISKTQVFMILGLIAFIVLLNVLAKEHFSITPDALFEGFEMPEE
ncbi:MAG: DUF4395 domain-containing protein [Flavobacteriaceae bacterium]|nr:DUF4395 domain-containing protein [Flavobacteriaceae bacterium]